MKILIIRFSSFGDVLQSLSVAGRLHADFPQSQIHWVTREEFVPLIERHPAVHKVWSLKKGEGLGALLKLAGRMRAEKFTHVYDAHNNLRSHILGWLLWRPGGTLLRRSIYRWKRFLLFRWRINKFPKPFSGQLALLQPLRRWEASVEAPPPPQLFLDPALLEKMRERLGGPFVALAPSAAFVLKRWPLEYWAELIRLSPGTRFVLLGGPEDRFLNELVQADPVRVRNLAGQLSLEESAAAVAISRALVANDTGLMHVAEQTGVPCLALMGPAPFGFPSRERTRIFEVELWCRPCSKHGQGPCVNNELQKCLRDIPARDVAEGLKRVLNA